MNTPLLTAYLVRRQHMIASLLWPRLVSLRTSRIEESARTLVVLDVAGRKNGLM